jgi:M6 family metalloprotease-like protein
MKRRRNRNAHLHIQDGVINYLQIFMRALFSLTFFFYLSVPHVYGIAPPHPDYEDEYRSKTQRRLQSHNETTRPKLRRLSPELCQGLSAGECRRLDDNYVIYTDQVRDIVKSKGMLRTLVLLVRFTDHQDRDLPSRDDISALWNAKEGESKNLVPTGSIREFMNRNSYGNFDLQADVMDWTMTDNSELYYSFDSSGLTRDLAPAMYPVLQVVDALGTDFSKYDLDGNGVIDSLVLMHSGFPAEIGGNDCVENRSPEQRIWSHAIGTFESGWTSNDGKYTLGGYTVSSAVRGLCGSDISRIGVLAHEFVHSWGIPDLYDTSGEWIGKGVGVFDIMSNPYGLDGAQIYPNNMGPWVKMQSGWLDPIEITHDGEYFIEASAENPDVYMIGRPFPTDEYILIENRQPIEWDSLLWNGGLLIWHIDDSIEGNDQRGYPGQFGWPGNGRHYRVAVASADRKYDLEKGDNTGDENDFWLMGNELQPGEFEYEATNFSKYPNTNSYQGGSIFPTGIRIYNISQSGNVMSFMVSGMEPFGPPTQNPSDPPTPAPTRLPTWSPSMSPTRRPIGESSEELSPIHLPYRRPSRRPTGKPSEAPLYFQVTKTIQPVTPTYQPIGTPPIGFSSRSSSPNCFPIYLVISFAFLGYLIS